MHWPCAVSLFERSDTANEVFTCAIPQRLIAVHRVGRIER